MVVMPMDAVESLVGELFGSIWTKHVASKPSGKAWARYLSQRVRRVLEWYSGQLGEANTLPHIAFQGQDVPNDWFCAYGGQDDDH
jgi:hypothetical protein